ncbi:Secretory carrier-associated membrane protein 2 [Halocaridina rubra]|uniref:Secretory carrier-associated membrane protein n=1 Tax=Halocaridina rubra TaxID=373956 RepID=A0AAN8XQP8_HALRR
MGAYFSREGRVLEDSQRIVPKLHQNYSADFGNIHYVENKIERECLEICKESCLTENKNAKEMLKNIERNRFTSEIQVYENTEPVTKRSIKITFNQKDLSMPLALTLESITRQDNWPPLPAAFPIGPCFYQDINVDIPLEFQKIVRMLYYLWMFHALMLLLNILGGLGLFIAFGNGVTFGLAILYFVIFTPFSYICWFRPIYKAFRSDSSFNFMVFFFVFFCQLVVSIVNAIGIPSMGTW